jgi:hypothetical protein
MFRAIGECLGLAALISVGMLATGGALLGVLFLLVDRW